MVVRFIFFWAALSLTIGVIRGEQSVSRYFELRKSQTTLKKAVEELDRHNIELADEITKIQQSPAYAEKVLRDKYHVTHEGEKIIFFAD
jgi:cell division protein FtsB